MAGGQNTYRDRVELGHSGAWSTVQQQIDLPSERPATDTWLQVDLGLRFPIHSIQIDESDGFVGQISFSDDGETWSHPDVTKHIESASALSIEVVPGEASWTRHVRFPTDGALNLDPGKVRIWSERAVVDLIVMRKLLRVDFDIVTEGPGLDVYRAYRLRSNPEQSGLSLVGIDLYENGAFGNFIIQCLLAIGICRAHKLKYIKFSIMDRSEVLDITEPREIGGITFIPARDPLPTDGYFLSGMFFDVKIQKLAGELEQAESRHILTNYIRPLFNRLPSQFTEKPGDQLLIHIRSGDIFSTWVAPHYPQPPLAFYKMVIRRLLDEKRISSIKMVFENRLNPVIAELEAHILELGIPLTTQSGTLADDVAALVNGRYLVFGLGTFGPGVCHLSDHVEQVFFFASGWPQHFRGIPTIGKITEVLDVAGDYTKVGEWDNSPARRQLMIDYPVEKLAFDDEYR
ncbi:discoidin domain-containing protein [Methylobacterium sp. J-070]|uniref:discoidin domain-containing protein n=1 Tax=Methylobacterium sp. J-070 TaxID=2836650 RepID=UPI001FB8E6F5|nr:discoidin domain-containing protein [Methylobacterium sp. J-070]MCJ2048975.1 discoidin domain-containing protein [Methylobacterium sp. J-070]